MAVLDIPELKVKTGISHRYLRPDQAIVDPELTATLPAEVVASCGLDVICHAAESFIARPYSERERPRVAGRPPALPGRDADLGHLVGEGARVRRPLPARRRRGRRRGARLDDARGVAGRASASAPPACTSRTRARIRSPGSSTSTGRRAIRTDHGFIPHGQSVIVTAPAAFRFTYEAAPERHHHAAELLAGHPLADAGQETLPELLLDLMRDVGVPTGLRELGYDIEDVDALVEGAMKQQRLLVVAPRKAGPEELGAILRASL